MDFWSVVSSVSTLIASTSALITVAITLSNRKKEKNELQYTVQPWFYLTLISRMGEKSVNELSLRNDGITNVKIKLITLKFKDSPRVVTLKYKYIFNSDLNQTGENFVIYIPYDEFFYGKTAKIVIEFENKYHRKMLATSPKLEFSKDGYLDIKTENLLAIPFDNALIEWS